MHPIQGQTVLLNESSIKAINSYTIIQLGLLHQNILYPAITITSYEICTPITFTPRDVETVALSSDAPFKYNTESVLKRKKKNFCFTEPMTLQ